MNITFNKTDYKILEILIGKGCNTPFISLTIKNLVNETGYSHVKVRRAIKNFQLIGYVKEGSKDGNSNTYYISDEGVKHYMNIMDLTEDDIGDLLDLYKQKNSNEKGND